MEVISLCEQSASVLWWDGKVVPPSVGFGGVSPSGMLGH